METSLCGQRSTEPAIVPLSLKQRCRPEEGSTAGTRCAYTSFRTGRESTAQGLYGGSLRRRRPLRLELSCCQTGRTRSCNGTNGCPSRLPTPLCLPISQSLELFLAHGFAGLANLSPMSDNAQYHCPATCSSDNDRRSRGGGKGSPRRHDDKHRKTPNSPGSLPPFFDPPPPPPVTESLTAESRVRQRSDRPPPVLIANPGVGSLHESVIPLPEHLIGAAHGLDPNNGLLARGADKTGRSANQSSRDQCGAAYTLQVRQYP